MDLFDRFITKFTMGDDCWEWTASKRPDGYGQIRAGGRFMSVAHRISYELFVGDIPEGLVIDHQCNNRGCVRPSHLKPMTIAENVKRGKRSNQNKDKKFCNQNHPLFGENLYESKGKRGCKICRYSACLRYRSRKADMAKVEQ